MFLYANVRIKSARRKHTPRDFYVLRPRAVRYPSRRHALIAVASEKIHLSFRKNTAVKT
ncbi:unknown [Prevotella sp. CAG:1185]|nr:unknown [Prevotella sp. CAG:1185]